MKRSTLNFLISLGAWIVAGVFSWIVSMIHTAWEFSMFELFLVLTASIAFIVAVAAFCHGMSLRENLR